MAEITIADAAPRVQYTVTGSTTGPWSIPWPFWSTDDIKVYFDATLKTITTHYTIAGTAVDDGFSSGNVTAEDAQENITVTIVRDVAIARTTDHSPGLFNIATLNTELDKLTAMGQQIEESVTRVPLVASTDDVPSSMALPTATSAASFLLWSTAGFTSGSSTQLLGGDGTVSLPFYSFTSDPDTGVYRIGTNNVGLAVGGAKIVDINSSGLNSIIGATTPAAGTFTTLIGTTVAGALDGVLGGNTPAAATATSGTFSGNVTAVDLTLSGDLTVNGSTTTLTTNNLLVKDALMELATGTSGTPANDAGIIIERGSAANAFMGWDESADQFIFATTTMTGADTGNLDNQTLANVSVGAITATSGTLAGMTSIAMSSGATLTAGFLDEDDMASDSAVAGVTQQSVKAHVAAAIQAPGIQMTWKTAYDDDDEGVGTIKANSATFGSISKLFIDDVERNSVSINSFIDTLDDPTATNSAYITITKAGTASTAMKMFKVNGAVESATGYSKVGVDGVIEVGAFSDNDVVGVLVSFSGDDGADGDVTAASTTTFTNKTFNANATGNALSNVDVADLAAGTDGELITWNASGVAATVGVGSATQVLTSNGAGAAPTFQDVGGGRLFGISDDFLTNTRVVDATDVGITTTAADVGSAISAQTLAAGDVIALWVVEACMAAAGSAQVSFGIEVNSTDYFAVGQNLGGTYGFFTLSNANVTHIRGLRGPFAYSANSQTVVENNPAIFLFDVDGLGIATGSQTIQVRVKEIATSSGATLQGSAGFDTRIAWALLKGS